MDGKFIPMTCVSWKDVQAYIFWLNLKTSKQYRQAIEAEWEYAAPAGNNHEFYFGNSKQKLFQYENSYEKYPLRILAGIGIGIGKNNPLNVLMLAAQNSKKQFLADLTNVQGIANEIELAEKHQIEHINRNQKK